MSVEFSREFFGWDRFSKMILMIGIFLFITRYVWILGAALIIYSIWRNKSTNVHLINSKIEDIKRKLHDKINNLRKNMGSNKIIKYKPIEKLKEKRKYIITICPMCSQKLRVPRGKGKIIITCSKCGTDFRLKT